MIMGMIGRIIWWGGIALLLTPLEIYRLNRRKMSAEEMSAVMLGAVEYVPAGVLDATDHISNPHLRRRVVAEMMSQSQSWEEDLPDDQF